MNKTLLIAGAGAIAANAAAIAATPETLTIGTEHRLVLVHHAPGRYTPPLAHKRNIPSVINNFATLYPQGLYNASTGAALAGPDTIHGQSWLAAAFTPAASATVTEVEVAAAQIAGPNTFVIHLYADAAGVPGKQLWSGKAAFPTFGDCCAVVAIHHGKGIPVNANTQYWIGITTPPAATNESGAWNLNVLDQVDPNLLAVDTGSGWQSFMSTPNLTFGIYGK